MAKESFGLKETRLKSLCGSLTPSSSLQRPNLQLIPKMPSKLGTYLCQKPLPRYCPVSRYTVTSRSASPVPSFVSGSNPHLYSRKRSCFNRDNRVRNSTVIRCSRYEGSSTVISETGAVGVSVLIEGTSSAKAAFASGTLNCLVQCAKFTALLCGADTDNNLPGIALRPLRVCLNKTPTASPVAVDCCHKIFHVVKSVLALLSTHVPHNRGVIPSISVIRPLVVLLCFQTGTSSDSSYPGIAGEIPKEFSPV
jgi:hypothetical protein